MKLDKNGILNTKKIKERERKYNKNLKSKLKHTNDMNESITKHFNDIDSDKGIDTCVEPCELSSDINNYISLGSSCSVASSLIKVSLKKETLPFDWMNLHLRFVYKILKLLFIDKLPIEKIVKEHFYYCNHFIGGKNGNIFKDNFYKKNPLNPPLSADEKKYRESIHFFGSHLISCDERVDYRFYNYKYGVVHPHDLATKESHKYKTHLDKKTRTYKQIKDIFPVLYNKYIRRFERLKNIILNTQENIILVYATDASIESCFRINGIRMSTNIYSTINKINKIISHVRNNQNYRIILLDSFQEEDKKIIEPNIDLNYIEKKWGYPHQLEEISQKITKYEI